jgi:hypothetical protein
MTTRWAIAFEAMDPKDTAHKWQVGISGDAYQRIRHSGHEKQVARLRLVREVLVSGTLRLYEGWSRPGKDERC